MTTRTRTSRTTAVAALAAAVTLALAACGGGEPEPTPTPTEEESTPLETLMRDYLGDWSNEDVTRQLVLMEDLIATCMAEQGFDYTPVDYAAMELDLTGEGLDLEWGSAEFAAQYGYGITTSPVLGEDAETPEDPNEEYVAAMSPSEQEAYHVALYGENYAEMSTESAVAQDYDWQDAGCTGRAQNEVLSGGGDQDDQFTALQDEMVQMMQSAADDPRLAQVNADWAACMADAGFPDLAKVGDAEAALTAEVMALQESALSDAALTDPTDPADPAVAAQVEAALAAQLAEITPREIDTAVADAECRADVGYDDAKRAVDTEYQTQFLAEHLPEIQAWMESLEERRTAD
jgi:hypothetical protein